MKNEAPGSIGLLILLLMLVVTSFGCFEERIVPVPREKLGLYVTPDIEESGGIWPSSYSSALNKAEEGGFSTIQVLAGWKEIEQEDGTYDWSILDMRINNARERGYEVGVRALIIVTGNDEKGNPSSQLNIPDHVDQDMLSVDFKESVLKFFHELASRYQGKIKYIAIGNSVNDYFELHAEQWEGFKEVYPQIVNTIHTVDPDISVISDLEYGGSFYSDKDKMQKYLDYFGPSNDDAFGFIFYFIDSVYYGDFYKFNSATLEEVLDEMDQRTGDKKVVIVETAMLSRDPYTGEDWTEVQSDYVEMLLTTAPQHDFIISISWFTFYDAKDLSYVPFDARIGLGFFDEHGNAKKAWETWKEHTK